MATKYTLTYKYRPPKNLKYLAPETTDIQLTFSVSSNDLNPLFLQELSDEVRSGYLIPLNDAWNDLWAKWDRDLEKKIPNLATKTKGAREKLVTVYVGPLETEFKKQIKNISSMAQTIGERYWQKMARERAEIRNFKLKVGANVAWKGIKISMSLATIISSGGAAAMAYIGAMKNIYGIYKEMKKVFASADDYMVKVYGDIEAIKTALFKRRGVSPENSKELIKATDKINRKLLSSLKSNRETLGVKIKELHRKAGAASGELDKALNAAEEALAPDLRARTEHRKKIQGLLKDIEKMVSEKKKFDDFDKLALKFQQTTEARIAEETMLIKAMKAGKKTATEVGAYVLSTSSDIAVLNAASSAGLNLTSLLSGWGSKLETGLSIISSLGIG